LINGFAWLGSSISEFIDDSVHHESISLLCHTALLLLLSIAFRLLDSIVSYERSKRVIKINEFEHSKFREGQSVDISIYSMKITAILPGNYSQYHVVYIRKQMFSISFISKDSMSFQAPC
jgi:hypothetical protein